MSEQVYLDLLREVLESGTDRADRTGVGTRSLFARSMRFDLADGFPLLTTKEVHFKSVAYELLWFLKGKTNTRFLEENGVTIWREWANEAGVLGRVYGAQWRDWRGVGELSDGSPVFRRIDQIAQVQEQLVSDPLSRRHVVSAWQPAEIEDMALPPCHMLFQFYVSEGRLSLAVTQRSADLFLGVPFNIASYALLVHLMAATTGYEVGELVWSGNDVHLYKNHFAAAREQLGRDLFFGFPELRVVNRRANVWEYEFSDIELSGYTPAAKIRAKVAV